MLAELPVGDPGLAFRSLFERERVNQDRPALPKLHIVGAAVFERHPVLQRELLDLQSGQRRVLELAETPLVGVGNEGHRLGSDDLISSR